MEIVIRKDAIRLGLKYYFTGKPCKHGHIEKRKITGGCMECERAISRAYQANNAEKIRARKLEYYKNIDDDKRRELAKTDKARRDKNKEKINEQRRARRANNLEVARAKARAMYARNPESRRLSARNYGKRNKEKVSESNRKRYLSNREERIRYQLAYAKKNLGACNARVKKYKMDKEKRTPAWLSDDDIRQMAEIYKRAAALTKETGIKHHVDHIIPLRGAVVSGLHVPSNLQILTAQENVRKSNSFMGMQ